MKWYKVGEVQGKTGPSLHTHVTLVKSVASYAYFALVVKQKKNDMKPKKSVEFA